MTFSPRNWILSLSIAFGLMLAGSLQAQVPGVDLGTQAAGTAKAATDAAGSVAGDTAAKAATDAKANAADVKPMLPATDTAADAAGGAKVNASQPAAPAPPPVINPDGSQADAKANVDANVQGNATNNGKANLGGNANANMNANGNANAAPPRANNADPGSRRGDRDDRGARWRFVQHNGNWWYWAPNRFWMVYRNNAWNRYNGPGFGHGGGWYDNYQPRVVTGFRGGPFVDGYYYRDDDGMRFMYNGGRRYYFDNDGRYYFNNNGGRIYDRRFSDWDDRGGMRGDRDGLLEGRAGIRGDRD
ncbi:hypothetical protein GC197_01975 [bacterium]|nr:hypothetical protein [bacterium]